MWCAAQPPSSHLGWSSSHRGAPGGRCLDGVVPHAEQSAERGSPTALPPLGLRDDRDVPWQRVSPVLVRVRSMVLAISLAPPVLALVVVALLWWRWAWVPVAVLVLAWLWGQWLVLVQVPAISYVELEDELAIRKGRMFRSLVTIPYGRIQYVDLQAGPLLRAHGLAEIEVHTASPESSGSIPGLLAHDAESLRERLSALGESRRAGL